jgi:hypothetical protein
MAGCQRRSEMAYLVVFMVNNAPHEVGDIISWRPEGSNSFGVAMLAHPWFRVIHCADMSDAVADSLTARQLGDRKLNHLLKERAFSIPIASLPAIAATVIQGVKAALSTKWDGTKYLIPEDIAVPALAVTSIKVLKPIITSAIG